MSSSVKSSATSAVSDVNNQAPAGVLISSSHDGEQPGNHQIDGGISDTISSHSSISSSTDGQLSSTTLESSDNTMTGHLLTHTSETGVNTSSLHIDSMDPIDTTTSLLTTEIVSSGNSGSKSNSGHATEATSSVGSGFDETVTDSSATSDEHVKIDTDVVDDHCFGMSASKTSASDLSLSDHVTVDSQSNEEYGSSSLRDSIANKTGKETESSELTGTETMASEASGTDTWAAKVAGTGTGLSEMGISGNDDEPESSSFR